MPEEESTQAGTQEERVRNVFQDGPYINAALLCESLLEEKNGLKSAVRIIDRITRNVAAKDAPDQMPPTPVALTLFLRLKRGRSTVKHQLDITLIQPNGDRATGSRISVNLAGREDGGTDVSAKLQLAGEQEGVHLSEVIGDQFVRTRLTLRLVYLMQRQGSAPQPETVVQ